MKRLSLFTSLCFIALYTTAGTVDTVSIYSNTMQKNIKAVVIKPDSYNGAQAYPVVYLLHGHGGNYANWVTRVPALKSYVDEYQFIIVCPDGAYNSWYIDSPVKTDMLYETHIAEEVPAFIDMHYKTIKQRKSRVITGLSMGGYGALLTGIKNVHQFGACGSMSGVVDLKSLKGGFGITAILGDTTANMHHYKKFSILDKVANFQKDSIEIIIDCGTDDFLFNDNRLLHAKLLQLQIPHTYIERPGKHDWDYWRNAIAYQLLFFRKFFDAAGKP